MPLYHVDEDLDLDTAVGLTTASSTASQISARFLLLSLKLCPLEPQLCSNAFKP